MKNQVLTLLFSILFLLLTSPSARAQRVSTTTGNTLLDMCESTGAFEQSFCLGYITGVTDMHSAVGSVLPENRRSCVAENVSNGQVKDVVVKYLKEHPYR
jgi:hypothetical protein